MLESISAMSCTLIGTNLTQGSCSLVHCSVGMKLVVTTTWWVQSQKQPHGERNTFSPPYFAAHSTSTSKSSQPESQTQQPQVKEEQQSTEQTPHVQEQEKAASDEVPPEQREEEQNRVQSHLSDMHSLFILVAAMGIVNRSTTLLNFTRVTSFSNNS